MLTKRQTSLIILAFNMAAMNVALGQWPPTFVSRLPSFPERKFVTAEVLATTTEQVRLAREDRCQMVVRRPKLA